MSSLKFAHLFLGLVALFMAALAGFAFAYRDYPTAVLNALASMSVSIMLYAEIRANAVREFQDRQKKMLEFDFDKTKTE